MALVLSRKPSEWIQVGAYRIRVQHIIGKRVSLAIEAPKDVQIWRGELLGKDGTVNGGDKVRVRA